MAKELGPLVHELLEILEQRGELGRALAKLVFGMRIAMLDEQVRLGDATGDFDHGVAAERKTGGPDPTGVEASSERGIPEKRIDHGGEVPGALPPEREAFHRVRLRAVVAGVVHPRDDIAVRRQRFAKPGHGQR